MQKICILWNKLGRSLNVQPSFRAYTTFTRMPVAVYDPRQGEIHAKKSLPTIPVKKKKEISYETIKTSGELFKDVMGEIFSTKNKKFIALEGGKLVEEGLRFGLNPKFLFLLRSLKTYPEGIGKLVDSKPENQTDNFKVLPEVHRINLKALQLWSSLETPPGIIGVFEKPNQTIQAQLNFENHISPVPLTVVLDNVRDPGNLGSILRTCAGIGCRVLLSKGCVDPWDMKSLRGGNGAQFLIPIKMNADLENLVNYMDDFTTVELTSKAPEDEKPEGVGIFLADIGPSTDSFGIPISPYTSVNYKSLKSVYLILGGETESISDTTRRTVAELQNTYSDQIKTVTRINIPMHFRIDSLNVSNSFGIIGYEIARQFNKC